MLEVTEADIRSSVFDPWVGVPPSPYDGNAFQYVISPPMILGCAHVDVELQRQAAGACRRRAQQALDAP